MMELTRIVKLDLISLKTLNCLFSFGSTTFPLQGFIKKKNLPTSTSVTRVVEGGEPSDFKCLFRDWPQPPITGKVYSRNRVGKLHFSISNQLPVFICPQFETSLIMAIHSSVITLFVYSLLLAFHMFTFGDIVYNGDTHCAFCVVLGFFFYIGLLCVVSAKTIQTKFDASTLHSNQQLAAETQMFDDGSGRVEVCTSFIGDYFNGFLKKK